MKTEALDPGGIAGGVEGLLVPIPAAGRAEENASAPATCTDTICRGGASSSAT